MSLGYPHPDFILPYLSSRQYSELIAYYIVEPFGCENDYKQTQLLAQIACILANVHRDEKKTMPFKPSDFIPRSISKKKMKELEEAKAYAFIRKQKLVKGN